MSNPFAQPPIMLPVYKTPGRNMASLARALVFSARSPSWSVLRNCLSKSKPVCNRKFISTSEKNKESLALPNHGTAETNLEYKKEVEKFKDTSKFEENWVSHGYNPYDATDDTFWHHHTMFFTVTLCLVGGTFIIAYYPDYKLQNWRQREAYLELARREQLGLPLVDPNFADPKKLISDLPTDEELGDTDIII